MAGKIMVIDDDQDMVDILQKALQMRGYEVVTALDGIQALRLLKTVVPDLIIADLVMPGMSGWHFTMKVRQNPVYKLTPIIVLSGLLEQDGQSERPQNGSIYVAKPFEIMPLMEKIDVLLKEFPPAPGIK